MDNPNQRTTHVRMGPEGRPPMRPPQGPRPSTGTAAGGMVHRRIFDHDHGDAALSDEAVVFQQHAADRTALAGIAQVERRHGQAILKGQALDGDLGKELGMHAVPSLW